ncbi:hypothetical protein ACVWW4_003817 [Bradyrhizobium sp. LB7.1]
MIATGEIVHIDASLIRANVSWESLAVRHVAAVEAANAPELDDTAKSGRRTGKIQEGLHHRSRGYDGDERPQSPARAGL